MRKTGRILLVLVVLTVAAALLYPTVRWYLFIPEETKTLSYSSREEIRAYSRGRASVDYQTLFSLLQEDRESEVPEEFKYLAKDAATVYELLSSFPSATAVFEKIEEHYREEILSAKNLSSRVLELGLDLKGGMSVVLEADTKAYEERTGNTLNESEIASLIKEDVEVLTARIDEFGVTEPDIRVQGGSRILIEVPGESDPERVESFIRGSGSLTFHLVDDALTRRANSDYQSNPSSVFSSDGKISAPSYIPSDRLLLGYYTEDEYGIDTLRELVVIYKEVALEGTHIESVRNERDQRTNRNVVDFHLDSSGGNIFYAFTSSHRGERLSVVLDGKVKSVAVINDAISQDVQLSGAFTEDEALSIAVALKSAALPIELSIISFESVGATLGDDSVSIAFKAIILGLLFVVLFMIFWYGAAGIVADFSLLINFFMMIALLSALHFTLTLSSIAGLVLTLGMAVDANVIIYEAMKDERRKLSSFYDSVSKAFSRAFSTILDSNVTTIIAAIVLSIFGSSTVKGFANTLAIGVACSLFTSLFVSHLIFDLFTNEEGRHIALSWRKR